MKQYNRKIEVIRVFKHFILEWENPEKYPKHSATWPEPKHEQYQGTEVYDSKEELLARIGQLL